MAQHSGVGGSSANFLATPVRRCAGIHVHRDTSVVGSNVPGRNRGSRPRGVLRNLNRLCADPHNRASLVSSENWWMGVDKTRTQDQTKEALPTRNTTLFGARCAVSSRVSCGVRSMR